MAQLDSLNMVNLLREGLEREVKQAVVNVIVKEQLKEFEATLREKIKPHVDSISFKGIESLKDRMRMREELHVFLHWDDDVSEKEIR